MDMEIKNKMKLGAKEIGKLKILSKMFNFANMKRRPTSTESSNSDFYAPTTNKVKPLISSDRSESEFNYLPRTTGTTELLTLRENIPKVGNFDFDIPKNGLSLDTADPILEWVKNDGIHEKSEKNGNDPVLTTLFKKGAKKWKHFQGNGNQSSEDENSCNGSDPEKCEKCVKFEENQMESTEVTFIKQGDSKYSMHEQLHMKFNDIKEEIWISPLPNWYF